MQVRQLGAQAKSQEKSNTFAEGAVSESPVSTSGSAVFGRFGRRIEYFLVHTSVAIVILRAIAGCTFRMTTLADWVVKVIVSGVVSAVSHTSG